MARLVPQDQSIKKLFIVSTVSIFSGLVFLAVFWHKLPPQVPLFYSRPWGNTQLAASLFLAVPVVLSIVFLFLNSILAQTITSSAFFKKALVVGAVAACILASITILRIILLIT